MSAKSQLPHSSTRARLAVAAAAARAAGTLSRGLGRGGGTALPGLVAEALAPGFVADSARQLPRGALLVTGTNGKTTTATLLAAMLRAHGFQVLHNTSGSNLTRGLAATLAGRVDWRGRLRLPDAGIGLFEVDEAAFARALPAARPRLAVITNLFRDQLDRYGDIDSVAALWRDALGALEAPPVLVVNADDPGVCAVAQMHGGPVVYFGVDDTSWAHPGLEHAADAKSCPECGRRLAYPACFFGHVGHYACPAGHIQRPMPHVAAIQVERERFDRTAIQVGATLGSGPVTSLTSAFASSPPPAQLKRGDRRSRADAAGLQNGATVARQQGGEATRTLLTLRSSLPGVYNVYNALAASAAALVLGVAPGTIERAVAGFLPAFGRAERVEVKGRHVYLLLAKNPVGMNEVLRTVFWQNEPSYVLFALNDLTADGADVSWIWDADFERAAGRLKAVVVSGRRADDLAVRLKYAQVLCNGWSLVSDLSHALSAALEQTPLGETLYVISTYTAMLELRAALAARGHVRPYWET